MRGNHTVVVRARHAPLRLGVELARAQQPAITHVALPSLRGQLANERVRHERADPSGAVATGCTVSPAAIGFDEPEVPASTRTSIVYRYVYE